MSDTRCAAVLDACVLYPAPLRDLLMWLAVAGAFQARWSETIQQEWTRHLIRNRPDLTHEQVLRTAARMNAAIPDAMVDGYERLASTLELPDANDRHVLAAAIVSRADVIVTFNLRDFPDDALQPNGIEAQHPDDFVSDLLQSQALAVLEVVRKQRGALTSPPVEAEKMLEIFATLGLVRTSSALRGYIHEI